MTDLFDDGPGDEDFALPGDDERLGRTPETAAAEPETAPEAETVEETAETPEETPPEAEAAETPSETAQEQAERLLAGKYKTPEDLERAYLELQQLDGRRGSEIAELRSQLDQRLNDLDNRLNQQPDVEITSDLIDTNPAYAAQMAYDQNNGPAFQAAFEQWKENDPTTAAVWAAGKQAEERETELRQAYDERIAGLEASIAPMAQTSQVNATAGLALARAAQLPGLAEFIADPAMPVLAAEFPDEAQIILQGTPDQKVRTFEKLFWVHRGRASDTHQATQEQVARDTAQAAQQAREDAFVASATTSTTGVKPSRAEEIGAEWDAMDAPYRDGWNLD